MQPKKLTQCFILQRTEVILLCEFIYLFYCGCSSSLSLTIYLFGAALYFFKTCNTLAYI